MWRAIYASSFRVCRVCTVRAIVLEENYELGLKLFIQLKDTTTELERLQEKVAQDRCVIVTYICVSAP
jgi:hypothetical protein